jgi:FkbM family methyltransferase
MNIVAIKKLIHIYFPISYAALHNIKKKALVSLFKYKYPNVKLFDNSASLLYSQENQDYIVYNNFFKGIVEGVFCDVGANHPLNFNNTRYFEEKGWGGYAFEPLPQMVSKWDKYRKAKLFSYALSDCEGETTLSFVQNKTGWEDMLSFIKKTRNINYEHNTKDIVVKLRKLSNVFNEEGVKHIDYMSIDVEGHEINVINGINFHEVNINVLTIENNSPGTAINGDDKIRDIMNQNGFVFWGRIVALDDIYVNKRFLCSCHDVKY